MASHFVDARSVRPTRAGVDARGLEAALRRAIEGEVRFDAGSRALYATDASNYRQVPIGVVVPRTVEDVVRTVAACREHGAPVLPRGGGTSLCGQCCNVAVVIDFTKHLHRIDHLDPEGRYAWVQPGVVLDDLRDAAEAFHLTFGPDPSTHDHNTLGGMIGNNSCGVHSVMAGETVANVIALDVLTYDGVRMIVGETPEATRLEMLGAGGRKAEIYRALEALRDRHADEIRRRYPQIPRRVSGYNLEALLPEKGFNVARSLVGSEGTCAVILGAKVRLVDSPPGRSLLVLGYDSVYEAGDHVPEILRFGPIGLEGIDDRLVADMKAVHLHPQDVKLLPDGRGWLLVEFGGKDREESDRKAWRAMDALKRQSKPPSMKLFDDPVEENIIWEVRKSGLGATAHVPGKPITWEGWEDSAVPPEKLGEYLRKLRALFEKHGYECDLYGHFGQGCVHTRIDFDLETAPGIAKFRRFLDEAARLVVSLGGSISGEHGDGQSKAALLPIMFGDTLMQAFREFKGIWDPAGKMNPGKVIDAYDPTENLRLGSAFAPPAVQSQFRYPDDRNDFSRATLRCVGVGECRKKSGLMCPSYKVTMEEMHSTRGRAHLLFEMLRGDAVTDGWKSDAVKEALDLCLSCKGCKGECPVHVDMATYKAEFMAKRYAGRLKPRAAYVFGLIDRWAHLASLAPGLVNFLTQTPPFSGIAKALAGVHPDRRIPRFAAKTFREEFAAREPRPAGGRRVILWPDTFNDHFHPATAHAAADVLQAAGYDVAIPRKRLCCGRPLYEFGMLDTARRYLRDIMATLAQDIANGTPIVVLEPACASTFRDELPDLFFRDEVARRLSTQVVLLDELLVRDDWKPAHLGRRAIVQGHCHQQAVLGMAAHREILERAGVECDIPDAGCCGMAGSFGFQKEKYDVSMACAERVLLPALREAKDDTLVIANGFSCREQVEQATGRLPMHLAEVLAMTLRNRPSSARAPSGTPRGPAA
ncbi:MAG TPA: FAD-binding and (Fe-S)-binding domain-containing protein [Usitatibacter sp.]|nr:FAD-binding and (Fe-S)-binding domain-containing protein [Usitatibacter sp.]